MLRFRAMWWLAEVPRFVAGMAASLLPHRHWDTVPPHVPIERGAFASGLLTLFVGAATGIAGFMRHAAAGSAFGTGAVVDSALGNHPISVSPAFNGLAIFTFLLLTPQGWLTMYLLGTGAYRAIAAYFDDPFGEPLLTGLDGLIAHAWTRRSARQAIDTREALEGPEVPDRVVSSSAAGIRDCDFAIVASRRKPGWRRGVAVFTQDGCYRIGEPVERTINGRLRTLYPLKAHADLEVVRQSIRYDLPPDFTR
jgi:hypothetical protein